MKKLADLRAHLLEHVAQLKADPAKLEVFVDKGDVTARAGSLSFEYGYSALIWITDAAGSPDDVVVPLLAWTAVNQPDLFEKGERKPFSFDAELIDAETYDLTVTIALTEIVRVEAARGMVRGKMTDGLKITHLPEPNLVDAFDGVPTGTTLWGGLLEEPGGTIEVVP